MQPKIRTKVIITAMQVRVTPFDNGWQMGEELEVNNLDPLAIVMDLAAAVHAEKDIDPSYMTFLVSTGGADQAITIPTTEWDRPLSDHGVTDGSTVRLEPLDSGCWQWHDMKFYEEQTVSRIMSEVKGVGEDGILIDELQKLVTMPPPMATYQFLPFVRMNADRFYVETNTTARETRVWLNRDKWVPVWL